MSARQAVDDRRVNGDAFARESKCRLISGWLNNNDNRQIEFFREFQVAFIVRRHATYRAGAVAKQHVISDPDWNLFVGRRINCVRASKHAGFYFR